LIAIKHFARADVKLSIVQISVVVADIQTSYLFRVVEIHSLFWTAKL